MANGANGDQAAMPGKLDVGQEKKGQPTIVRAKRSSNATQTREGKEQGTRA